MKRQYFAWKNGKQTLSAHQEWEDITAKEFLEICKSNIGKPIEKQRFFARIPCAEDSDYYYVMECDYSNYLKSNAECVERFRKRLEKEQLEKDGLWFELISLDFPMADEDGEIYCLHDVVAEPDFAFEEKTINSMILNNALSKLSDDERKLIDAFYLSDEIKTERQYAAEFNEPNSTIHSKKIRVLKKMKKCFAQN